MVTHTYLPSLTQFQSYTCSSANTNTYSIMHPNICGFTVGFSTVYPFLGKPTSYRWSLLDGPISNNPSLSSFTFQYTVCLIHCENKIALYCMSKLLCCYKCVTMLIQSVCHGACKTICGRLAQSTQVYPSV